MEVKKHRMQVVDSGKRKDNEDLCKKFLSCHRAELKELLFEIAQKKLKKQNGIKRLLRYWIQMAKVTKIGSFIHKKFVRYKKKRAADTLRLFKAMRIYMFLKGNISVDSLGVKDRIWKKIILYI